MSSVITKSIERGTKHYLIYADKADGLMLYTNIVDEDGDIRSRYMTYNCGTLSEMVKRLEAMRDDLSELIFDVGYSESYSSGAFNFIKNIEMAVAEEQADETEEENSDG